MDRQRFDALARVLVGNSSRRTALVASIGGALALVRGFSGEDAEAHKNWVRCKNVPDKKKRAKCVKKGKEHKKWHEAKNRSGKTPQSWQLDVPFLTQVGSAPDAPNSGANNCGPASVAMTINYYGNSISVDYAARIIRDAENSGATNGITNFKGDRAGALHVFYGMTPTDVWTFDGMRAEIARGRPVIVLVNNNPAC